MSVRVWAEEEVHETNSPIPNALPHVYLMCSRMRFCFIHHPVAASEHGLKIMAMLYLTPVLPLGLVSYMCGTTAMDLSSFALAKIFSLPLYLIYTFIGASAHSFIRSGAGSDKDSNNKNNNNVGQSLLSNEARQLEENQFLIVSGLVLSVVMMMLITQHIRKELMKVRFVSNSNMRTLEIMEASLRFGPFWLDSMTFVPHDGCPLQFRQILDQQKKERGAETELLLSESAFTNADEGDEKSIELGLTSRRKMTAKAGGKQ
jgi:hypothetical protein